jgi:hypothetical protein
MSNSFEVEMLEKYPELYWAFRTLDYEDQENIKECARRLTERMRSFGSLSAIELLWKLGVFQATGLRPRAAVERAGVMHKVKDMFEIART